VDFPISEIVLCPFHSETGHLPQVVRSADTTPALQVSCLCERWTAPTGAASVAAGLRAWQSHVGDD
jgi:hypothetical protein